MNNQIINELRTSPIAMVQYGATEMNAVLNVASRANSKCPEYSAINQNAGNDFAICNVLNNSGFNAERIAVISITGMMTKYARINWDWESLEWIVPGVDDVAALLEYAMQSGEIDGVVLVINTPGGTTQSLIRIEEVLKQRTKPVVALVDGMCASAGMYMACLCDQIYALNKMCSVGSIGVMVQLIDETQMLKKNGIKVIEIYPPESADKNKAYRDAIDGKTQTMIEEVLTPLAVNFQNIVREHRALDESVEGVLSGKMFYADDAVKAGLIDQVGTFEAAVHYIRNITAQRQDIVNAMQ